MTFYAIEHDFVPTPSIEWEDEPQKMELMGFSAGAPLRDLSRLPSVARQKDSKRLLDAMIAPGLYIVSGAFRQAVEEFDPGIHQFFPITFLRKDGSLHDGRWYILNICGRIPCLIPNEPLPYEFRHKIGTSVGLSNGSLKEPFYTALNAKECKVSRPAVQGRHLWQSWVLRRPAWICSEPLLKRWDELCYGRTVDKQWRQILGLRFVPIEETDQPWIASEIARPWYDWALAYPEEVEKFGYGPYVR